MAGHRLDVFAGGHGAGGQCSKQRPVARRGVGEKMQGERRQFGNAKRPRNDVALSVGTEGKRCVEMISPALRHPSTLGDFAHQRERSASGDRVDAQTVGGVVAVHDIEARADAEVGPQHGEGLVLGTVNTVHVDGPATHLHAVNGGSVGRLTSDRARRTAARLLGIGQGFVPVLAREFVGVHRRQHRDGGGAFGHGSSGLTACAAADFERRQVRNLSVGRRVVGRGHATVFGSVNGASAGTEGVERIAVFASLPHLLALFLDGVGHREVLGVAHGGRRLFAGLHGERLEALEPKRGPRSASAGRTASSRER